MPSIRTQARTSQRWRITPWPKSWKERAPPASLVISTFSCVWESGLRTRRARGVWLVAPRVTQQGKLNEKANRRFDAPAIAAVSRTFAREAALKVAEEGLRWVCGAGGVTNPEMSAFETSLLLPAIHCAQAGLISDMDLIADVLYARAAKPALAA